MVVNPHFSKIRCHFGLAKQHWLISNENKPSRYNLFVWGMWCYLESQNDQPFPTCVGKMSMMCIITWKWNMQFLIYKYLNTHYTWYYRKPPLFVCHLHITDGTCANFELLVGNPIKIMYNLKYISVKYTIYFTDV